MSKRKTNRQLREEGFAQAKIDRDHVYRDGLERGRREGWKAGYAKGYWDALPEDRSRQHESIVYRPGLQDVAVTVDYEKGGLVFTKEPVDFVEARDHKEFVALRQQLLAQRKYSTMVHPATEPFRPGGDGRALWPDPVGPIPKPIPPIPEPMVWGRVDYGIFEGHKAPPREEA